MTNRELGPWAGDLESVELVSAARPASSSKLEVGNLRFLVQDLGPIQPPAPTLTPVQSSPPRRRL